MATIETHANPALSTGGGAPASDASAGSVTPQGNSSVQDNMDLGSDPKDNAPVGDADVSDGDLVITDDDDAGAEIVDQPTQQRQSKEIDTAFANLRREKEALAKELQRRDAWVEQNYGSYGIKTWDQYQAAVAAQQRQQEEAQRQQSEAEQAQKAKQYEERVREYGLEPEDLLGLVANSPLVKQLEQKLDAVEQERQQLAHRKYLENITGHVEALVKKYPHIQSVEDIDAETRRVFNGGMNGISLVKAYEAVHHDELVAAARTNGEKGAAARIGSKDHLGTERAGGSGELGKPVRISREEMATWRAFGYKDPKDVARRKRKYLGKGK